MHGSRCSVLCCLLLNLESLSVESLQTRVMPLAFLHGFSLDLGNRQSGCTSQVRLRYCKCSLKYNAPFHPVFFHFPTQQHFIASVSPPSGACLLPLSLQPTNVGCSGSHCPGPWLLLANLGDQGSCGFPQSSVVRSPLAARPHSPSSPSIPSPASLHPE